MNYIDTSNFYVSTNPVDRILYSCNVIEYKIEKVNEDIENCLIFDKELFLKTIYDHIYEIVCLSSDSKVVKYGVKIMTLLSHLEMYSSTKKCINLNDDLNTFFFENVFDKLNSYTKLVRKSIAVETKDVNCRLCKQ